MTKRFKLPLRFIVALLITLTVAFGGGYFFGFYRHHAGVEKELHLAAIDLEGAKDFISDEQLIYLYEVHNLKVFIHDLSEFEQPIDLYFVSSQQLEKYLAAPLLPDYSDLLSADFLKIAINPNQFFPIGWKIVQESDNRNLLRTYFFVRSNSAKDDVLAAFFDLFFNPEFYMNWIKKTELASTLALSENFPDDLSSKRASKFREISLVNLSVETPKLEK